MVVAGENVGRGWESPSGGPRAPAAALGPGRCCAPTPGLYRCQSRDGLPCAPPIAGSRGCAKPGRAPAETNLPGPAPPSLPPPQHWGPAIPSPAAGQGVLACDAVSQASPWPPPCLALSLSPGQQLSPGHSLPAGKGPADPNHCRGRQLVSVSRPGHPLPQTRGWALPGCPGPGMSQGWDAACREAKQWPVALGPRCHGLIGVAARRSWCPKPALSVLECPRLPPCPREPCPAQVLLARLRMELIQPDFAEGGG